METVTMATTGKAGTDHLQMAPSEERLLPERRQVNEGYVQADGKSNSPQDPGAQGHVTVNSQTASTRKPSVT